MTRCKKLRYQEAVAGIACARRGIEIMVEANQSAAMQISLTFSDHLVRIAPVSKLQIRRDLRENRGKSSQPLLGVLENQDAFCHIDPC